MQRTATLGRRPLNLFLALATFMTTLVIATVSPSVPASAQAAPLAPFPNCVIDGAGNKGLGCLPDADPRLSVSVTGTWSNETPWTVTAEPNQPPCGYYTSTPNCYWEVMRPSFGQCVYLNNGDPNDVRSCTPYSSLFRSGRFGGSFAYNSPFRNCAGQYDTIYAYGGPDPDATWAQTAPGLLACEVTWKDAPRPDNLKGPTFFAINANMRFCGADSEVNCSPVPENVSAYAWIPVEGDLAPGIPSASCRVTTQSGPGGSEIGFENTSTVTGVGQPPPSIGWTFPDGSTSRANLVNKTATEPGTYTAQILAEASGKQSRATCSAEVAAPELVGGLRLRHDDESDTTTRFDLDEEFTVELSAAASSGLGDLDVSISAIGLFGGAQNLDVLEGPTPAIPQDVALEPNQRVTYSWRVKAAAAGRFRVAALLTGTDAIGRTLAPAELEANGSVSGLTVEIILPEDTKLDPLEDGEGEDADGDGLADDPGFAVKTVPVKVKVTADEAGSGVENVSLLGIESKASVLDIDLVRPGAEPGLWVDVIPQPLPFPWSVATLPVVPPEDIDLEAGESYTFELEIEGDRPGTYELTAVATAASGAASVTGHGSGILAVVGDPILSVQLSIDSIHGQINPSVTEGRLLQMTGRLENISIDERIEMAPLRLKVEGGLFVGPVELTEALPTAGEVTEFAPTLLPEIPDNRAVFTGGVLVESVPGFGWDSVLNPHARLDVAFSGEVIDADGNRRPLVETDVVIEWGIGETKVNGKTFLEARIDPVPIPAKDIDPGSLAARLGEYGASRAAEGFANFGTSSLDMFKQTWERLKSGDLDPNLQNKLIRYGWTIGEHYLTLYRNLPEDSKQEIANAVADDMAKKFSDTYDSGAAAKGAVDQAVQGFFTSLDRASSDAGTSTVDGNVDLLADALTRAVPAVSAALAEELTGAALIAWFSKANKAKYLDEVVEAVEAQERKDLFVPRDLIRRTAADAGSDPRLMRAGPRELKSLPAAVKLAPESALLGWAVDRISDSNMRRLTDWKNGGLPIVIAIRSRADETLIWLDTQLGIALKPFLMKQKNVGRIDCEFLGYRCGSGYGVGDVGSVALAEPIPYDLMKQRIANVDSVTQTVVEDRWLERWKEWHGDDYPSTTPPAGKISKRQELFDKAFTVRTLEDGTVVREGFIDVPKRNTVPIPGDNIDTMGAASVMEERAFQLRKVPNPPDGILVDRDYFEVWMEDVDGVLKRVGGDIDIVAVTDLGGSTLSAQRAENVAVNLQHAIDAQHPWSSTLKFEGPRKEFLDAHKWDPDPLKRGEPLLVYVDGEARTGWFDPAKSISYENPLDSMLFLKGGPDPSVQVTDLVQYQSDLRNKLPNPTDIAVPGYEPPKLRISKTLRGAGETGICTVQTGRQIAATAFRLTVAGKLTRWLNGLWVEADPATSCSGGSVVVLPETGLKGPAAAGTTRLPVFNASDLGLDESMFQVGDEIIVGLGTDHEESRFIVGFGSILIDTPLEFDHAAGEAVLVIRPVQPTATGVVSLDPARLFESRVGDRFRTVDRGFEGGGALKSQSVQRVQITGRGVVPDGASAAVLNVAAVDSSGVGNVRVYPCSAEPPNASSVNLIAGGTVANEVIAKLTPAGEVCVFVSTTTDLIIDATGYVSAS